MKHMNVSPRFPPLNPQPAKYPTPEARQGAEADKRKRLSAEIQHEVVTPLQGCERVPNRERQAIWDRIRGAKAEGPWK